MDGFIKVNVTPFGSKKVNSKLFKQNTPFSKIIEDDFCFINKKQKTDFQKDKNFIVSVFVDNVMISLNELLTEVFGSEISIKLVFFKSKIGHEIYRRSISFVLRMAAMQEYPNDLFTIEHRLGNGYLCHLNSEKIKENDKKKEILKIEESVKKIKSRMNEIIKSDLKIYRKKHIHKVATKYFSQHPAHFPYTNLLLKSNNKPMLYLDTCGDYKQIHHRVLVSHTSILNDFDLIPAPKECGIYLKFSDDPFKNDYDYDHMELLSIYKEYEEMTNIFKIKCVGNLNQLDKDKKIKHFIALDDAYHNGKIRKISHQIVEKKKKLILISGPSASGKTTFAKKLGLLLEINGFNPVIISVDNYYKPNKECPLTPDGKFDFETIEALRLEKLNQDLKDLLEGKEIESPLFDFKTGKPKAHGVKMKMNENDIIVMEGIHCLNPKMTPLVKDENKFKIFLAPLSQINLDEGNYVSNETIRLTRRIVRDYNNRNNSVESTLSMWQTVLKAEHEFIFPFLKYADVIMNTSLDFEVPALKVYCKPLLNAVPPTSVYYYRIRSLLDFLNYFNTISDVHIPKDCLLREFIGGSIFEV